jgi:LysM domain
MRRHIPDTQSQPRQPRRSLHPCALRRFVICVIGMVALVSTACGELEPMVEPEIVDLQLTLDTLKTQVRDAQRNLAEVRTELESRRQELADAQVARAQLEGRVREAERRVSEARHIIELQREELMAARVERERVFRSSSQLQSQMKQLQKKTPKFVSPSDSEQGGAIAPTGAWLPNSPNAVGMPRSATPVNAQLAKTSAVTAALRQYPYTDEFAVEQQNQRIPVRHVFVKPGDTLWSLSRKYRISLNRLRSINHLTDNQIEVGQILFVSEHRVQTGPSPETNP